MADILAGFFYIHGANFHPHGEGFYKRDETQLMTVHSDKNYQKNGKGEGNRDGSVKSRSGWRRQGANLIVESTTTTTKKKNK